ncbi:MAG: anaerobic ribonucleoside-triphosphate reductase activating protein [Candidatus Omnitrophica bacterium]|nr:anaerobic ribonucleoside-triphosphate reductase activating protein [Candidatus Omnitrophota bacterium]
MSGPILSNQKDARSSALDDFLGGLPIGGITPFTTIDFPGRLAAVFYTQGCPWRCRYCYNSPLWPFESSNLVEEEKLRVFLENRKGLLDGIVFSGGEPTLHPALGHAMQAVKRMGFQAALHTAGMFPERLREVIPLCDWVGMDVKAPFGSYEKITRVKDSGILARESVDVVLASGVDCEFRTTYHPDLLTEEDLMETAEELSKAGARSFVLQAFFPQGCLDEKLKAGILPSEVISDSLRRKLLALFPSFYVRGS